jgi:hypothetical protein
MTICLQPSYNGPCTGSFQRWYYNHTLKQCFPFKYGGCRGKYMIHAVLKCMIQQCFNMKHFKIVLHRYTHASN